MEGKVMSKHVLMTLMVVCFLTRVKAVHGIELGATGSFSPQFSSSLANTSALAPSPSLSKNSGLDFIFRRVGYPRPEVPQAVKNIGKKTACPGMCAMFCFGSRGVSMFAMCTSPCLLQCFLVRGVTSANVVPQCTFGSTEGLSATYDLDEGKVGGYMETCYDNCRKYLLSLVFGT